MKNCFKALLILSGMIMLCCCADDNDDAAGNVISAWEEPVPIVTQEYSGGVWDSMIILRSRSDIEVEINTSRMKSEAYAKITAIDFNKYDVLLCWTNNEYHDFISIEEIKDSIIIRTKKRIVPHYAIPYMYYTAVRISKTNLPNEKIKYVCEKAE